jgi:hypothetical protein
MRKLAAALAKSESWSGVHKAAKVHHVKPASESWAGQHWTARKLGASPRSESWS